MNLKEIGWQVEKWTCVAQNRDILCSSKQGHNVQLKTGTYLRHAISGFHPTRLVTFNSTHLIVNWVRQNETCSQKFVELFTATKQTCEIISVQFIYWLYSNLCINQLVFLPAAIRVQLQFCLNFPRGSSAATALHFHTCTRNACRHARACTQTHNHTHTHTHTHN